MIITLFGGTEIQLATYAKRLAALLRSRFAHSETHAPRKPTGVFFTAFGGVDVTPPTLAEEVVALQQALRAGEFTLEQWDQYVGVLDEDVDAAAFTLFGSFEANAVPKEDAELETLAFNRHVGYISDEAAEVLMPAIGYRGGTRANAVRQAVAVETVRLVRARR